MTHSGGQLELNAVNSLTSVMRPLGDHGWEPGTRRSHMLLSGVSVSAQPLISSIFRSRGRPLRVAPVESCAGLQSAPSDRLHTL